MKKILMSFISCVLSIFVICSFGNMTSSTATNSVASSSLPPSTSQMTTSSPSPASSLASSIAAKESSSTPSASTAFPLPEGMTAAPSLLSAALTSEITFVIKSTIKPTLMKMITAKEPLETSTPPDASLPIATFKPVGPPPGISTFSEGIPTSTEHTSSMGGTSASKSDSAVLGIKSLKPQAFTGSFDMTNRYVFRGISQSANNMAFQGGLTYTFLTTGIYLNVWGSNVDFLSRQGQQASVKADTIGGLKNTIGKYFTYDLSMVRYNYPKASGANYNEFITVLTYRILTMTLGYSPNAFNAHANGLYYNGGFNIPIPEKYTFQYNNVSLIGNYGHYNLSKDVGLRSYSDFMLGLKKSINQYILMLQWIGTNGEAKLKGLDANRLVATLAVNF